MTVLPNTLRLVGLAVAGVGVSAESFIGFDEFDRLAAQSSPASETFPNTPVLRNASSPPTGTIHTSSGAAARSL